MESNFNEVANWFGANKDLLQVVFWSVLSIFGAQDLVRGFISNKITPYQSKLAMLFNAVNKFLQAGQNAGGKVSKRLDPKSGRIVAKVGLVLLICIPLFASCAAISGGPPPPNPVCERPEFADSWICKQLQTAGFEYAEDAQDLLLDANDVALILEAYTVDEFKALMDRFKYYLDFVPMSYTMFLDLVISDTGKAKRLASIVKRRFSVLKSSDFIRNPDLDLLRMSVDGLRDSV